MAVLFRLALPSVKLEFDEFTFDPGGRQLLRRGEPVHLTPKAVTVLHTLIDRRPDAVSKADLFAAAWPDVAAPSDQSLTNIVEEIRDRLGDTSRDAKYVRTVRGYGYAFRGDVRAASSVSPARDAAALPAGWLFWNDRALPLRSGENILGRDVSCDVRLEVPGVSRRHANVRMTKSGASIEDLRSTNGTLVDGRPIDGESPLRDGDAVQVGPVTLTFRLADALRSAATERIHR